MVRTRVYVSSLAHWEAVARAHGERFRDIQPANTLVEARLVGPEYLVEIEAEAEVSRRIVRMHIGGTPLIRLEKVVPDNGVEIWVKWEGANPTGSMKDRMALSMIQGAVARGQLRPGGRVVEYTGGSTGSSLAMVCAALGFQAHFVSSDAFAEEKLQTMRAFGARLDVLPSEGGKITPALIQSLIARARELVDGAEHRSGPISSTTPTTRPATTRWPSEILDALGGRLDEFVMMVGTSGCFSGNAVVLKEKLPGVRCVAGEPATSRALSRGRARSPAIASRAPARASRRPTSARDLADAVVAVSDADAYATARRLAREEGIFGGISSGANVWIALQRARALAERRAHRDHGLRFRPEVSPGRSLSVVSAPDSVHALAVVSRRTTRAGTPARAADPAGRCRWRPASSSAIDEAVVARPAADRRRRARVAGRLDARAAAMAAAPFGRSTAAASSTRRRQARPGTAAGRGAPAPSTPRSATPRCRRRASTFPGCA